MILGNMRDFDSEESSRLPASLLYPEMVARALRLVQERDLASKPPGRYELAGESMFALVQEVQTRPFRERRLEAHRTYADIQLVVEGTERIGFRHPAPGDRIVQDDREARDIAFYADDDIGQESELVLTPGMFAVFWPSELHRPCCAVEDSQGGTVKKVVIKLRLERLTT